MSGQSAVNIANQIYIALSVEGSGLTSGTNLINTISVHENLATLVPVMQFKFNDRGMNLVRDYALTEGTKVEISLGKSQDDAIPRTFRVFGSRQAPSIDGPMMFMTFILDCPKYVTESYSGGIKGNSSDVISQIASDCGLEADVESTQDEMTWLSFGRTRASFSQDVAMHGYASQNSSLAKCLTSTKKLRYKDLFKQLQESPIITFAQNDPGDGRDILLVRESRDVSNSGVMNSWLNYGWNYTSHSLTGKSNKIDKFEVKSSDNYLPINSEVKKEVGDKARVEHNRKWDCRNTHENYNQAYYQNMRGLALFSEKIHILVEDPSGVEVFDSVELEMTDSDGEKGKNTGSYIVSAKVIYISNGSAYYEKLELIRPSVRQAGNTKLVGS